MGREVMCAVVGLLNVCVYLDDYGHILKFVL